MSDWQKKLDLTDVWNKYPDEITVQELCKIIADRLKKLENDDMWDIYPDDVIFEWCDLIDEFEILASDEELTVEEFDHTMEDLYDWGDTPLDDKLFGGKKVCWIATNF